MTAKTLINDTIPPLKLTDTGYKALAWMGEFHVQHLPIIDGQNYAGIISEYEILDLNNPNSPLENYDLQLNRIYAREYDHIYDVLRTVNQNRISVIPVLDEDDQYIGMITLENLLDYVANSSAVHEPGGIIVLEMNVNDYSLSQIAQIVESNNGRTLNMSISTHRDLRNMEVTLKINKKDLTSIIATFERYGYRVKATYQEEELMGDFTERYEEFMNYLSI